MRRAPRGADEMGASVSLLSQTALMSRSPLPELAPGPPPEVLDEIGAAWERAQASPMGSLELAFDSAPAISRAWGELRLPDGTVVARLRAGEAVALACGDMVLQPV
jgi:hypothetical protein